VFSKLTEELRPGPPEAAFRGRVLADGWLGRPFDAGARFAGEGVLNAE
jgi:hypothetical protein